MGVDIGGNVTLECEAEGFPQPEIYWQRLDGGKIASGDKVTILPSGQLYITGKGFTLRTRLIKLL